MEEPALRELRALVARRGGPGAVLLAVAAEEEEEEEEEEAAAPRRVLPALARDLLQLPAEEPGPGARRAGERALRAALLVLLCPAAALRRRARRRRLREVVRDLRARLPAAPPPALVGALLLPDGAERDAERERRALEALLRAAFAPPAAPPGAVRAAAYRPAQPGPLRLAAAAALAAAQPPADGKEREKRSLPAFLRCFPWGRRSRRKGYSATGNHISEDGLQDPEEGLALTSVSPNGICDDAGGTGP